MELFDSLEHPQEVWRGGKVGDEAPHEIVRSTGLRHPAIPLQEFLAVIGLE